MGESLTCGVHHVGLTVSDLEAAVQFFRKALGWKVVGGDPDYPSIFVSDGRVVISLWRVSDPVSVVAFDRRSNVGLHHLALTVSDEVQLKAVFERVGAYPGVVIEFAPEPSQPGSKTTHFICTMPGGIRIEFATPTGE